MHPADKEEIEKLHQRRHEDRLELEKKSKVIIEQAEEIRRLEGVILDAVADLKGSIE